MRDFKDFKFDLVLPLTWTFSKDFRPFTISGLVLLVRGSVALGFFVLLNFDLDL